MNPNDSNTETDAALQHQNSAPAKVIGRPFKPGESGNPSGRRRGSVSLKSTLKSRLTKADAKAICDELISQARAGNLHAQRLILENCGDEVSLPCGIFPMAPPIHVIVTGAIAPQAREPLAEPAAVPVTRPDGSHRG